MLSKILLFLFVFFAVQVKAAYINQVTVSNFPATQAVTQSGSWTIDVGDIAGTISLPVGASTEAKQDVGNSSLSSIDSKTPALVSGRVPVDGSGVTQPVSASSLPLPSGAATAANQTTANSSLSSIDGKIVAVNTGAVVVSSSALPSGASTAANQTTANSSLSSIDGKIVAVNTGAVVVSSSALPTGAATSANQTTANTSLSTIATNTTGVATAANQTTGNSSLSTIATNTTGVSTAANQATANSSLSSIVTNTTGLQLQTGANTFLDKTGSGSLTALNDQVQINANGLGVVGIQLTGTWVGTVIFEGTNDGSTYFNIACFPRAGTAATFSTTNGNTQGLCLAGGLSAMRARRSVATSGTAVVTLTGSAANSLSQVYQLNGTGNMSVAAIQSGTWTVQPGNTQNTTPWYVQQKGSFSNITTATTTTVKSGAGVLKRFCYNTVANGSTATIYDNTAGSGTTIGLITPPNGTAQSCMAYDLTFSTGLTVVTVGTSNITVVYE